MVFRKGWWVSEINTIHTLKLKVAGIEWFFMV